MKRKQEVLVKDLNKPHNLSVRIMKPMKNIRSLCCDRKMFKLIAFVHYDNRGIRGGFKHTRFYAVCKTHFEQLMKIGAKWIG